MAVNFLGLVLCVAFVASVDPVLTKHVRPQLTDSAAIIGLLFGCFSAAGILSNIVFAWMLPTGTRRVVIQVVCGYGAMLAGFTILAQPFGMQLSLAATVCGLSIAGAGFGVNIILHAAHAVDYGLEALISPAICAGGLVGPLAGSFIAGATSFTTLCAILGACAVAFATVFAVTHCACGSAAGAAAAHIYDVLPIADDGDDDDDDDGDGTVCLVDDDAAASTAPSPVAAFAPSSGL
jgi:hypothetical protein